MTILINDSPIDASDGGLMYCTYAITVDLALGAKAWVKLNRGSQIGISYPWRSTGACIPSRCATARIVEGRGRPCFVRSTCLKLGTRLGATTPGPDAPYGKYLVCADHKKPLCPPVDRTRRADATLDAILGYGGRANLAFRTLTTSQC